MSKELSKQQQKQLNEIYWALKDGVLNHGGSSDSSQLAFQFAQLKIEELFKAHDFGTDLEEVKQPLVARIKQLANANRDLQLQLQNGLDVRYQPKASYQKLCNQFLNWWKQYGFKQYLSWDKVKLTEDYFNVELDVNYSSEKGKTLVQLIDDFDTLNTDNSMFENDYLFSTTHNNYCRFEMLVQQKYPNAFVEFETDYSFCLEAAYIDKMLVGIPFTDFDVE